MLHIYVNSILGSATWLVTGWSLHHLDRPRWMKSILTLPVHLGCNQGKKCMGRCKMCTCLYASSRCSCESCLCYALTQEGCFADAFVLCFGVFLVKTVLRLFESSQFFFQAFQHVPKKSVWRLFVGLLTTQTHSIIPLESVSMNPVEKPGSNILPLELRYFWLWIPTRMWRGRSLGHWRPIKISNQISFIRFDVTSQWNLRFKTYGRHLGVMFKIQMYES